MDQVNTHPIVTRFVFLFLCFFHFLSFSICVVTQNHLIVGISKSSLPFHHTIGSRLLHAIQSFVRLLSNKSVLKLEFVCACRMFATWNCIQHCWMASRRRIVYRDAQNFSPIFCAHLAGTGAPKFGQRSVCPQNKNLRNIVETNEKNENGFRLDGAPRTATIFSILIFRCVVNCEMQFNVCDDGGDGDDGLKKSHKIQKTRK